MKYTRVSLALVAFALLATPVLAATDSIKICTGNESGVYYDVGKTLQKWSKNIPIQVIESEGSLDNIELSTLGQCDAFIAQPDALNQAATERPSVKKIFRSVGTLHREYLQVLCGRESGYDDLGDLEGTTATLNIGPPGSGSWVTWQNLVKEDSGYESIKTVSDPNDLALSAVSGGDTDCMLVASGLNSGTMQSANSNYGDAITLVGANDKDFNDATSIDGKTLYTYAEIDGIYDNLNGSWGIDTISWNAQVYANTESMDSKKLSALASLVAKSRSEIIGKYGK